MLKILLITLSTIIVAYLTYVFITLDRRSNDVQILAIIQDATASAQKHDAKGVMADVSKDYKDQRGINYERLRLLVVQVFDNELKYKISTTFNKLDIGKDRANANIHVEVKMPGSGSVLYDRDLAMVLKKENSRHALIIPERVWRITSVDNLGFDDL